MFPWERSRATWGQSSNRPARATHGFTAVELQPAKEPPHQRTDEPEELLARVAKYRSQLVDVRAKLEALQSTGPEARGNARQLTELAALADRAAERLQSLGDASVTVRGVLDPRAQ